MFFLLFCLLKTQPFMHYSTSYIILYFILLYNFELVINRLVERLVVGIVDTAIAIYRGTVVRLTAVGDAIVSLGRRITRRQPSTGVQVFIDFNIFVRFMHKNSWALIFKELGAV
jgi:hypothetical protein